MQFEEKTEEGMMDRFKCHWFVVLLVAVIAGIVVFAPTALLAQSKKPETLTMFLEIMPAQDSASVQAYWTAERMAKAIPKPLPVRSLSEKKAGPTTTVTLTPTGSKVIANSGMAGDKRTEQRGPATAIKIPGTAEKTVIQPLWGIPGTPFAFTRYRVFPDTKKTYQIWPYYLVGKLFFTGPDGVDYVASASVINANNNSVVWTAGHCVWDPGYGLPNHNFYFEPGYYYSKGKYGVWTAYALVTIDAWANYGQLEYDLGALVMNRSKKKLIGQVLGFLGWATNLATYPQDYYQHWHLQGYPQAPRPLYPHTPPGAQFDGQHLEFNAAGFGDYDWPSGDYGLDPTVGVGCDLTGGCSGGPWVLDFSSVAGDNNKVNGNNSYRYVDQNGNPVYPEYLKLYSPYFGDAADLVRDLAQFVPVP